MYNNIIYNKCKYTKTNKISPNPLDTGFKNMFTSTYLKKKKKKIKSFALENHFIDEQNINAEL
jgi:formamidopyrimidine-DNA glycosylase